MRTLSLAAGVMTDVGPVDMVGAAAAAGWPACGIWYDHSEWTSRTTREIQRRAADNGLSILDVEPIIPSDGRADNGESLIDVAAELGAPFVLFASRLTDTAASADRFARLCEHAQSAGVTVVCEFLPIFPVNSLDVAMEIVRRSSARNAGVLVDNLHLSRSGGSVSDVVRQDPALFPYVQIADAPAVVPATPADLAWEAMKGRSCPGEGQLPIAELLEAIPNVPISFEVRSEKLLVDFPDPVERAAHVWSLCRSLG